MPIAGSFAKVAIDRAPREGVEDKIQSMWTLTEKLLSADKELGVLGQTVLPLRDGRRGRASAAAPVVELDPTQEWGRLRRVLSAPGTTSGVCHARTTGVYDPGLPVLPEPLSFTHISLLTEVLTVIDLAVIFHNTAHLFELSNEPNENTITV